MKLKKNLLHYGICSVLIFDCLGSVTSRTFEFNYAYLAPLSALIYCAIGFLATRKKSLKTAVSYTAQIGLIDATIGWTLAILLKPYTDGFELQPYSLTIFIVSLMLLVILSSVFGLIGGGIALIFRKKNQMLLNR